MKRVMFLIVIMLLLAGCSVSSPELPTEVTLPSEVSESGAVNTAVSPTSPPLATAVPATQPSVGDESITEPTIVPTETAVPPVEPTPMTIATGRTAEGAYFLGNPDAPITLIDYSDFL